MKNKTSTLLLLFLAMGTSGLAGAADEPQKSTQSDYKSAPNSQPRPSQQKAALPTKSNANTGSGTGKVISKSPGTTAPLTPGTNH